MLLSRDWGNEIIKVEMLGGNCSINIPEGVGPEIDLNKWITMADVEIIKE